MYDLVFCFSSLLGKKTAIPLSARIKLLIARVEGMEKYVATKNNTVG